jgi:hypothetical protein
MACSHAVWLTALCMPGSLLPPLFKALTWIFAHIRTVTSVPWQGVVSVYLDDILIFTCLIKEHWCITQLILNQMHEHKPYLWPEKCEFEKIQIKYLGVIISHNKVKMYPVKIAGVADGPTPSNKKEVQSFIGFINFYCQFIPGFSHHACTFWSYHEGCEVHLGPTPPPPWSSRNSSL